MSDPFDVLRRDRTPTERDGLEKFLDYLRDAIVRMAKGVSEDDARRRLVPTPTTLGGLVKHLAWVELSWFQRVLAQTPSDQLPPNPWSDGDEDAGFRMEPGETVDGLIAEYEQRCAESRDIAARHSLDHAVALPWGSDDDVSLRWIYLHMIEETARHAGHADILREQIDGTWGN